MLCSKEIYSEARESSNKFYNKSHTKKKTRLPKILINISSDNGLLPVLCLAITWTNADLWLIGPLGTNFDEIRIASQTCSLNNMHLEMLSANMAAILFWPHCVKSRILIFSVDRYVPTLLATHYICIYQFWCDFYFKIYHVFLRYWQPKAFATKSYKTNWDFHFVPHDRSYKTTTKHGDANKYSWLKKKDFEHIIIKRVLHNHKKIYQIILKIKNPKYQLD